MEKQDIVDGGRMLWSLRSAILWGLILLAVVTEAKLTHGKNNRIHTFFDDDSIYDDFIATEVESEPSQTRSSSSAQSTRPTNPTLPSVTDATPSTPNDTIPVNKIYDSNVNGDDDKKSTNEAKPSKDLCSGVRCRIGRVCRTDDFGGTSCVCGDEGHCADHGRRVCGSDGQFYPTHCEMHRAACVKKERIRVERDESKCDKDTMQDGGSVADRDSAATKSPVKLGKSTSEADDDGGDEQMEAAKTVKVDAEKMEKDSETEETCTEEEYEKLIDSLLQYHCIRTGNRNCVNNLGRHQLVANVMFSYYDHNSDERLDETELDAVERRDHLDKLSHACRLHDMIHFNDKDNDLLLSTNEFYAALKVPAVSLDAKARVFKTIAVAGTSLELKCDVHGTADYLWKRNGHSLQDLTDNKIKVFEDGSLYIHEVALYHVGNYSCEDAKNEDVVQTHQLTVQLPPIVEVGPKTQFRTTGSTVTIHCHAEGIPLPEVSWIANETPLSEKPDRYLLLHEGHTLQIKDADYLVDTGTYQCKADNVVGTAEGVATLFLDNTAGSGRETYADGLYGLFVAFTDHGYSVYEPSHCHIHHVVGADFRVIQRVGTAAALSLCDGRSFCGWGNAVNVRNTFIYATQPQLNRIVVIEIQDRLNPVEIISVDGEPVDVAYVEHLDQVWVVTTSDGKKGVNKSLLIVQYASADVHHTVVHTQPVASEFDTVKGVFLPPNNALKQTFDYGYAVRGQPPSLYKIDLNSMKYVRKLDLGIGNCVPRSVAFVPLAGQVIIQCNESESNETSSSCLSLDYVSDKTTESGVACGEPFVSPDSRHLVIVTDDRKTMTVYRVQNDGAMESAFEEKSDMSFGDVTFFASEAGYDLFATFFGKPNVFYLNLRSGHTETTNGFGQQSKSFERRRRPPNDDATDRRGPKTLVSGGVFSDFLMTPSNDALYVFDGRRRRVQCEWQNANRTSVVAWVEPDAR